VSNNIDVTLTANSQGAEQALQKVTAENDRLSRQIEKMAEKSGKASRESSAGMSKVASATEVATRSVMGLVGQYASLAGAIGLAIKEHEKLTRLQESSRQAALPTAQAVRDAKYAFEADATVSDAGFEPKLKEIADRTGASVPTVAKIYEMASSAKDRFTQQNVFDAVEAALAYDRSPEKAGQGGMAASRMLGIAQISGTTDMQVNAGFLQSIGQASHGKNMEQISRNLIPAINAVNAFGDDQEIGGELGSTLSQLLQDDELANTATALVQMSGQLKNFHPTRAKSGKLTGRDAAGSFTIPDEQFAAYQAGGKDTYSRMDILRKSPELMRAFLGGSHFEEKSKAAVQQIITGEAGAMASLEESKKVIRGTRSEADRAFHRENFAKKIAFFNAGESQPILTTEQQMEANMEKKRLADPRGARIAASRDVFSKAIKNVNLPGIDFINEKAKMAALNATFLRMSDETAPEDVAISRLKDVRNESAKAGRKSDAAFVQDAIRTLEKQKQSYADPQMEAQTKAIQEQTRVLQNIDRKLTPSAAPQPYAPPAARNDVRFRFNETGGF
jgi:hypothetical protein